MSSPSGPHDAVFRRIFGTPSNAASQLRAALPPAVVARLDLDQLTPVPGSLVDTTLRWRHADLLFSVPLDGRPAFVYVLIEHQSSTDPLMAFRMLRYVTRIWDRHLTECPTATRLPAVIPLVVHQNKQAWSAPVDVADLVDLDPDLVEAWWEYLPRFRFYLDDLATMDLEALRARPLTPAARLVQVLLRIAPGNPRLAEDLRPWVDQMRAVLAGPGGQEEFVALLRYIQVVADTDAGGQLHTLIISLGPAAEEAYMTIAEQLRAEGEVKGEVKGQVKTLIQQMTIKFGPLPEAALITVRNATADQLQTWTARILTADSLDQLFR
jgi:predicted transposase YdaD